MVVRQHLNDVLDLWVSAWNITLGDYWFRCRGSHTQQEGAADECFEWIGNHNAQTLLLAMSLWGIARREGTAYCFLVFFIFQCYSPLFIFISLPFLLTMFSPPRLLSSGPQLLPPVSPSSPLLSFFFHFFFIELSLSAVLRGQIIVQSNLFTTPPTGLSAYC